MRRIFVVACLAFVACSTFHSSQQGRIARLWHGRVPDAKAAEYYDYLLTGVHKIEATPGNRGVDVLTSSRAGVTDFIVISYWDSLEAIHAFAGADVEKTHHLPRDAEYLLELEPTVRHYTVRMAARR
ncbi:MAG TPA: antibiotic biosynthesis monooxygenase [Thermoanaerobaculia bacterium]|jgi:heme-degrading monooxygenase HmoA|nr:antibiotic biosynthesis monooxygenase [Thermoanaerobaculia bacterium]